MTSTEVVVPSCLDASLPSCVESAIAAQAGVQAPITLGGSYAGRIPEAVSASELHHSAPSHRGFTAAAAVHTATAPDAAVTAGVRQPLGLALSPRLPGALPATAQIKSSAQSSDATGQSGGGGGDIDTQNSSGVCGFGGAGEVSNDVGQTAPSEPNFTMRRLLKVQATAAAIAFNMAYEQENNTPSYDRLRITPLRLGSGLAASAMPVSSAPPPLTAPPPCASSPTRRSVGANSDLLAAAGATALAHRASAVAGACAVEEGCPPLKRRRLGGDGARGDAAGGSFKLAPEFEFVLNRCFNCGSYGHDLRSCKRPRNNATISIVQREWLENRGAVVAERRRAKQAATAAQRRGSRHKASHGRYFSTAVLGEEDDEGVAADAIANANCKGGDGADIGGIDPAQGLTQAPPGVRPGVLSAALAAALGLTCCLDPPPWLAAMALYGIPPAYCCGPYLDPAAEAAAEPPAAEVAVDPPAAGSSLAAEADPPPPLPPTDAPMDARGAPQACLELTAAGDRRGADEPSGSVAIVACAGGTAAAGVAERSIEPDGEEARLLRPLLPDAPDHVPFPGLNAPPAEAASRDRWRRALGGARRAAAFVEAVRDKMLRGEQRRQQQSDAVQEVQGPPPHHHHQQQQGLAPAGQADGHQQHQQPQEPPVWPACGPGGPQLHPQQWQHLQQPHQQAMAVSWQQQQHTQHLQAMCWQQQQMVQRQMHLQQQQQELQFQRMRFQQQQQQQQQGFEYRRTMGQQQQCWAGQGVPFVFGGPNFQGYGR